LQETTSCLCSKSSRLDSLRKGGYFSGINISPPSPNARSATTPGASRREWRGDHTLFLRSR
jgi:hypothetical protein